MSVHSVVRPHIEVPAGEGCSAEYYSHLKQQIKSIKQAQQDLHCTSNSETKLYKLQLEALQDQHAQSTADNEGKISSLQRNARLATERCAKLTVKYQKGTSKLHARIQELEQRVVDTSNHAHAEEQQQHKLLCQQQAELHSQLATRIQKLEEMHAADLDACEHAGKQRLAAALAEQQLALEPKYLQRIGEMEDQLRSWEHKYLELQETCASTEDRVKEQLQRTSQAECTVKGLEQEVLKLEQQLEVTVDKQLQLQKALQHAQTSSEQQWKQLEHDHATEMKRYKERKESQIEGLMTKFANVLDKKDAAVQQLQAQLNTSLQDLAAFQQLVQY